MINAEAIIKNTLYLSPSGILGVACLSCLWYLSLAQTLFLSAFYAIFAISLFIASYRLGKYGYDRIESASKVNAQAVIDAEKEKTNRRIMGHNSDMQKIQAKQALEEQKLRQNITKRGVSEFLKRL